MTEKEFKIRLMLLGFKLLPDNTPKLYDKFEWEMVSGHPTKICKIKGWNEWPYYISFSDKVNFYYTEIEAFKAIQKAIKYMEGDRDDMYLL